MSGNSKLGVSLVGIVLAAAIFAFDLAMPLGVAGGVPYVALVFVGLWMPTERYIYLLAIAATILTAAGYFFSPSGGLTWIVLTNRGLAIFVIWATAILIAQRKRAQDVLVVANEELEARVQRRTQDLAASEKRFRDFASTASDWYWEIDAERRYTYMSAAVSELGRTPDLYDGANFDDVVDQFYNRADWAPFYEAFEERKPIQNFLSHRTEGDEERWILSNGVPFFADDGSFLGFRATSLNITDRKLADDELRASEDRYRALSDLTSEGVAIVHDGAIAETNQAFADMYGYSVPELVGKAVLDLIAPEYREEVTDRLARNQHDSYEIVNLRKDGSRFPVDLRGAPIFYQGQRMRVVRMHDLTETHQAAAAIRESEERLRHAQKIETVGQLTGGIAHDFNNILAAIIGNLDLVEIDKIEAEFDRENISTALRVALRGAELTHRLLAFSRQQALDTKKVQINDIVPQFVQLAERTIGSDIAVETKLAADLWPALVDAGQFENALLNLAVNARDAMPDGGRLMIETANQVLDDDDTALYEDLAPGDYVMIAVSDSGMGMPPDVLEKVFEPFYTTKDVGKGSGLGLSMVFGFARQSGGQASIASAEGEGTTVRIYLPRAEDVADTETVTEAPERDRVKGSETILVVEDDKDLLAFLVKVLKRHGYTVLEAANGPAALDRMAAADRIDLLLTDVVLPHEMNGRDIAIAFREQYPASAVLYSSGYARDVLDNRGQLDEGVELIDKPFRPRELAQRVREVLDRHE
ncbi:MAG: PAS domain S-box protein [Alphaproteobacteria bacterium]|nr:PAS domain S-box protein [Alphaproteobacteria bacterium]